ncbi:MAG: ABC transporter ATP-binding protein [Desulfuromonadales bacterium]|nr:ABC transporter ATP-binding protein [Desulfuromonadales bacterium]
MLLSVERINVAYGHARVLSDVSLNLDKGERVFVVGRNGAGKTTLLKTIAGFLTPTEGKISFAGETVNTLRAEQMANLGVRYVYQDKRVFTRLTVRENIQLAAFAGNEKLDVAIDRVVQIYPKISQFLDTKAGGLSGGQKQLLLLGRALIGDPKLLLIDEPTEGLAAGIIEEVFKVLEMLKGQVSMLIVEQNLAVVRELADRVYAMKEGKIPAHLTDKTDIRDNAVLERYL